MRFIGLITALLLSFPIRGRGQTVYAVVLGNQQYVVGSSTLHSGLFRSGDRGRSWTHLGPDNLKAYSMDAVDSARGRILYIAAGNGVHRSTDYGASWKILTDWRMTEVMDVKVDQRNPRWIYAATAFGLWRSGDGGKHWENPAGPLQSSYCYRIAIDSASGAIAVTTENRVLSSSDRGDSFASSIGMRNPRVVLPVSRWWIASGSDSGPMLLLTAAIFPPGGPPQSFLPDSAWRRYQATRPTMNVYALALGGDTIYAGGESGIWRFGLSGRSGWTDISDSIPNGIIHAVAALPTSGDLLVGTFGSGIYRREHGRWSESGLEGSQVWSLVVKNY